MTGYKYTGPRPPEHDKRLDNLFKNIDRGLETLDKYASDEEFYKEDIKDKGKKEVNPFYEQALEIMAQVHYGDNQVKPETYASELEDLEKMLAIINNPKKITAILDSFSGIKILTEIKLLSDKIKREMKEMREYFSYLIDNLISDDTEDCERKKRELEQFLVVINDLGIVKKIVEAGRDKPTEIFDKLRFEAIKKLAE